MEITHEEFWAEVAKIGWGTKTTSHKLVKHKLALQWSPEKCASFDNVFRSCRNKLYRAIEKWEKENDKRLDCSDDGMSDLTSHIVGLGETEFRAVLDNPKLAYERAARDDYKESFAYVIPDGNTMSEATEHLPVWKAEIMAEAEFVRTILPDADPLLTEVLAMVTDAGSLPLTNKAIQARHQKLAKMAENCKYSGPVSNMDKVQQALGFFSGWKYVNYITDMQDWSQAKREVAA